MTGTRATDIVLRMCHTISITVDDEFAIPELKKLNYFLQKSGTNFVVNHTIWNFCFQKCLRSVIKLFLNNGHLPPTFVNKHGSLFSAFRTAWEFRNDSGLEIRNSYMKSN